MNTLATLFSSMMAVSCAKLFTSSATNGGVGMPCSSKRRLQRFLSNR
ncbi:Uncharacterised protein [Salmonella enterica subsp. enterica serovar Typhi]|nr:Uncharacterised protein [Salmonella enterica subsp. enterica serovar Typhi]CER67289.1 Uncharacterised protein [Salmonella enterica subsp. enterica serovar Typhi]CES27707.1 Uncharacterised protein [Salmonella enterica subsp. enterica serovar Typhi]CES37815.1 Uncharacterised protein [Salmonella enterica subsp. enterica serovar Typhi]CGA23009.1 Uncharacterised protein [Salmonella enterica subsp. enterica serovar Typhi]